MRAQGIHNALLALLDGPSKYLADYGRRAPWVWIGVVGRDAVWPLKRVDPLTENLPPEGLPPEEKAYSWQPKPVTEAASIGNDPADTPPLAWPVAARLLLAVLARAVLLHAGIGVLVARLLSKRAARPRLPNAVTIFPPADLARTRSDAAASADRDGPLRQEYRLSVVACSAALVCGVTWFLGFAAPKLLAIGAIPLLLILLGAAAVAAVWPRGHTSAVDVQRALVVFLGLFALCTLGGFLVGGTLAEEGARPFQTARAPP